MFSSLDSTVYRDIYMLEIINNSTRMSNHGWIVVWEYYTAGKLIKLCRSEKKIENARMQEREK